MYAPANDTGILRGGKPALLPHTGTAALAIPVCAKGFRRRYYSGQPALLQRHSVEGPLSVIVYMRRYGIRHIHTIPGRLSIECLRFCRYYTVVITVVPSIVPVEHDNRADRPLYVRSACGIARLRWD